MIAEEVNVPDGQQQQLLIQVPLTWVGADEVPIQFVNQVLGQLDDAGDLILSFGQATPPAIMGNHEAQRQQAQRIAYVPVRPIARFSMSRARLNQVMKTLQDLAAIHDAHNAAVNPESGQR